jgi:hypothetical protein
LLVIRRSQTSENAGVIGQVPNPQPAIDAAMPTMQNAIAAVASHHLIGQSHPGAGSRGAFWLALSIRHPSRLPHPIRFTNANVWHPTCS